MTQIKSTNIDNKGFSWEFTDKNDGSFTVQNADFLPSLYFPLMNTRGMKAYVTPELKGDICSSFHNYLTAATVTEELHRNVSSRNFWISDDNNTPWSATGNSASQKAQKWSQTNDLYSLEVKPGSFTSKRIKKSSGISVTITTFVPETEHLVELMKISIENISSESKNVTPTYCIPVFARSADNFRDHRQVTTMFQKNYFEEHGVRIKPNIVHDEKGHIPNKTNYIVLGFDQNGNPPSEKWILAQDFIGDGGSFDNPEAVFRNLKAPEKQQNEIHGKEAVGAFRFNNFELKAGETHDFIILHGITDNQTDLGLWKEIFGSINKVNKVLEHTHNFWQQKTSSVIVNTGNNIFDNWVKWISFQVICRQIFGNSYLPDFGYGRGGRGWRDLWQDLLSIFLVDPESAKSEMLNNFMGIRIDGSNATIIGTNSGEFKADRNDIPRTWCDHGAWPAFILNFYLNQTGDYQILFNQISYWKDKHTFRSKNQDKLWNPAQGNKLLTLNDNIYTGTLFEHVLIQQLSAFYNVGNHNILLLEGGDWNDTYDMARENGESVCFHNFYSQNLNLLAETLIHLKKTGVTEIELLSEITCLLDTLPGQEKVDYNSPESKQNRLKKYFETVQNKVSGKKNSISIDYIIDDLKEKAEHNANQIRNNEIIETKSGIKFFNGHYDNTGKPIGGEKQNQISMDLTSQVMPVLCNISDKQQTADSFNAIQKILKTPGEKAIRLCTEFKDLDLNVGRITGFVYGNKEHGSKWMQQNIMLAYGLYAQDFVNEGYNTLKEVEQICNNTSKAKTFPGIPSYFNNDDRGVYAYLTGSSSWYLLTLTTQVLGVRGKNGNLCIDPKLVKEQFDKNGKAKIEFNFKGYRFNLKYNNPQMLDYYQYKINKVTINTQTIENQIDTKEFTININEYELLNTENEIIVELSVR